MTDRDERYKTGVNQPLRQYHSDRKSKQCSFLYTADVVGTDLQKTTNG